MKTSEEVLNILQFLLESAENRSEQLFCYNEINYVTHYKELSTFDFNTFKKRFEIFIKNHEGVSPLKEHIATDLYMSKKMLDMLK